MQYEPLRLTPSQLYTRRVGFPIGGETIISLALMFWLSAVWHEQGLRLGVSLCVIYVSF